MGASTATLAVVRITRLLPVAPITLAAAASLLSSSAAPMNTHRLSALTTPVSASSYLNASSKSFSALCYTGEIINCTYKYIQSLERILAA